MSPSPPHHTIGRILGATAVVVLGTLLVATFFQQCLSSRLLASNFMHPKTWFALVTTGSHSTTAVTIPDSVNVPFTSVLVPCSIVALVAWFGGAIWLVRRNGLAWTDAVVRWGFFGWFCWCAVDLWEWLWIAAGNTSLGQLFAAMPQLWLAGCLACWITTWMVIGGWNDSRTSHETRPFKIGWLWLACGLYIVVFTTMNWRLYFNLFVPHGDSVMYEEHLWNFLHGKGFRSYLDQGLFLGEHIQFVHLFLIPLYVIWPSHLLLEACSSTALACGAFPVYWMVRRHTGSDRTAFASAVAYLLYSPMQFLDIEIDLKTFRPESFGIPMLLLTLDQLDRKHPIGTLIGILFCLTVKEDYAIIFGPLGVWIALSRMNFDRNILKGSVAANHFSSFRFRLLFGGSLSVFSVAYLWLATRVIMPWFRSGAEVHYASYFARFGKTPEEIIHAMATRPNLVFDALVTAETMMYAILLLAPLAFLPVLSPARLSVGLPLFGILCLNELEGSRTPQHQFHGPLVAIIFWSLAAAMPRATKIVSLVANQFGRNTAGNNLADGLIPRNLVWTSALATGLFFGLSPLGMLFWDSESSWYWQRLYGRTHRASMFARIADLIPPTARVASTDFVHPRFTHYERSYDYSDYQRKVSGDGNRIPDDTDYLVIDTDHRYSKIKLPSEVPELRDHSDHWELLPDKTEGCFIVLKRRKG